MGWKRTFPTTAMSVVAAFRGIHELWGTLTQVFKPALREHKRGDYRHRREEYRVDA